MNRHASPPTGAALSKRDNLLRAFSKKIITRTQFYAGRVWQALREEGELQPCRGVEWDVSISEQQLYQHSAISDMQAEAFHRRSMARRSMGQEICGMLDVMLDHNSHMDIDPRLLSVAAVFFGFETDRGQKERPSDEPLTPKMERQKRLWRVRQEQPSLFAPTRTRANKNGWL